MQAGSFAQEGPISPGSQSGEEMGEWVEADKLFGPSMYSIQCGPKSGTGWVIARGDNAFMVCTAKHVISLWPKLQPIYLTHYHSGITHTINRDEKIHAVYSASAFDCAFISIIEAGPGTSLPIEGNDIPTIIQRRIVVPVMPLGTDVGWMGFPSTTTKVFGKPTLTLMQGHLCAMGLLDYYAVYCIDGTVNQGMSGAPVWTKEGSVIGLLTHFAGTRLDEKAPGSHDASFAYPGIGVVLPIHFFLYSLLKSGEFTMPGVQFPS